MKKKFAAFVCSVAAVIMLFSVFGSASARYGSSVTVTEPINYSRTAGTISIYMPDWVYADYYNNNEAFPFTTKGTPQHVHYKIENTATINGTTYTNDIETQFYIRVIAQTEADEKLFSSWSVCKYDTWGAVGSDDDYTKNDSLGAYGPFTLGPDTVNPEYLDVIVTYNEKGDLKGIRTLRVQMFGIRADGSEKIISQDDLRIMATNESAYIDINLDYYSYGSKAPMANASQKINVANGTEIDFTDTSNLDSIGIKIPDGYSFVVAKTSADGWAEHYDKLTATSSLPIQVTLVRDGYIPVMLQYWDRSKQKDDGSFTQIESATQEIQIRKGSTVDFTDQSTLTAAGIILPDTSVYKYVVSHCNVSRWWHDTEHYFQDRYNVPADPVVSMAILDVYVAPIIMRDNIEIIIENASGTQTKVTTTKNASGATQFTYNGATYTFSADGKITFTYAQLQQMFGSSNNSFDVYVKNGDNALSLANVKNSGSVTVDYFKIYQGITTSSTGYCLANSKMQLYIKSWGYVP